MSEEKRKSIRDAFIKFKQDPELNSEQLLSVLEKYRVDWTAERRKTCESQWRLNAAFYAGNHFVRDYGGSQYRVRLKENHTNNILSRMLSVFMQNLPVARVFSNSSDWEDDQKAQSTEQYLKAFHRKKQMELKYMKLIKYSCGFGSSFIYHRWNSQLGGRVLLDASETETGREEMKYYHGDSEVKVDDPFKVAARPGIDEIDDMWDIIRSEPVNRWSVISQYGEIDAESAKAMDAYTGDIRMDDDIVMMHHYYHKPTPWFEEGLYACWVGKKLIKVREATQNETKLPIIHLPFDRPYMKFYGISTIEQIMDLQEQLNRAASMIIEARNLMARPRVLVSHEAELPVQSITDRPGEVYRYKLAGGRPIFETPTFNFNELAAHKGDTRNALSQVSGMTSASRGEIPAATRTALALQLVLEQDRSQYLPFIKTYHAAILATNEGICADAAEYISEDDPRSVKIEGMEGTKPFHGGMVPDPLDIYLEDSNPLGWTAAGKTEAIMELANNGIEKDPNKIKEMLHLHNDDPAYKALKVNKQAATKEIELMNRGLPMEIGSEDDDVAHLDEHTLFIASFNFRKLPKLVQDLHKAHADAHKKRLSGGQNQAPPLGGKMPSHAGSPESAGSLLAAPQPGQNLEKLLGSARAG
jgi:hypothetical protein